MKTIARYGYMPFMLVGVNGLAMFLSSRHVHVGIPILLAIAVACSFGVERLIPYDEEWNRPQGDSTRDLLHALVNEAANVGAVAILPVLSSRLTVVDAWPRHWPFALQVIFAVLVLDIGITVAHWASHRVDVLWRLHAVHHSVKRFYGFNGLMKHPLHQAIELGCGAAPLLLIGLPLDVAEAMAACVVVQLLLQHSNADYRVGPLRTWLALNEGHRFHHLKWPGIGDVNFGLFTLVWDRLLGTFSFDPTGRFTSDDLGIAKWPRYPSQYLEQLAAPFHMREQP